MKFSYPEGATPIDDISGLKPQWVKSLQDLNMVEVENIAIATSRYLHRPVGIPQSWFAVSLLQKIHLDMFHDVWEWAGSFRRAQTIPGVSPYRISIELEALCDEVNFWAHDPVELTLVEQAARLHHQLVFIHPFPNGNGRFSRLVADRYLKAWNCPFPQWPVDLGSDGRHRKQYIAALKQADKGDIEDLVQYMLDHGAKDPSPDDLVEKKFYKNHFSGERLELMCKAYHRRGYS